MIRVAMTKGRIQKQVTILLGQAGFDMTTSPERPWAPMVLSSVTQF